MALLSDLLTPVTADQAEARLLALLQLSKLPVMSWGPSNPIILLVHNVAVLYADASFWIAALANGHILEKSFGEFLVQLARSQFNETKPPATFTAGKVLLVETAGAPQNIVNGQHLFSTPSGVTFRATQSVTVPALGQIECTVRAVKIGASSNVPNDSITVLQTSVPGVTVSNPPIGVTGTWITSLGTDLMSDESFQEVCRSKWATLATGSPKSAYKYWALITAGVSRAKPDDLNPGGPNTIWVYIDNAAALGTLQATLTAKQPAGTIATAKAATAENVAIPGVVTVLAANRAAAEAAIAATLVDLANTTDIQSIIYRSEIVKRIKSVAGVVNVVIGSGFGNSGDDYQLGTSSYPQFTLGLTYVEVS